MGEEDEPRPRPSEKVARDTPTTRRRRPAPRSSPNTPPPCPAPCEPSSSSSPSSRPSSWPRSRGESPLSAPHSSARARGRTTTERLDGGGLEPSPTSLGTASPSRGRPSPASTCGARWGEKGGRRERTHTASQVETKREQACKNMGE